MMRRLLLFFICLFIVDGLYAQNMTIERLDSVLQVTADSIQGGDGVWEFYIYDLPMICISDPNNNRMRIVTPVSELVNLKPGTYKKCMEANFHSALDVKYAVSDDLIWVCYIHPLRELSVSQLQDAIRQVFNAAYTFGDTYSSTNLIFPGQSEETERN